MKKDLAKKCKKIKLVITDVDGVLTDGGMYYTSNGDVMKKFHVKDGMGVTLLRRNHISTIIITKEKTMMVKRWAKKMKIERLYDGVRNKESMLEKICSDFQLHASEIAYIGDDVNDLELMKKVGFSVTPRDGINQAKDLADYICSLNSGQGVLREIADMILDAQFGCGRKLY